MTLTASIIENIYNNPIGTGTCGTSPSIAIRYETILTTACPSPYGLCALDIASDK
jgi:hypothetical protein